MRIRILGDGEPVVLLPSLGRGGADFDQLAGALVAAGYRCLVVDPPGVADVVGPVGPRSTLHDLAALVAEGVAGAAPVHLVGHAFGGRLARCLASDFPQLVRSLVVLGGGGRVGGDREALEALERCFDPDLSADEHLAAVATAFFAPGNDPSAWAGGWWPEAARIERAASQATPVGQWWSAGTVPVLVVVGRQDRVAPLANARALEAEYPDRVSVVEVDGAGHALLPERPEAVAAAVLGHLRAWGGRAE